jgi:hypothetical protein
MTPRDDYAAKVGTGAAQEKTDQRRDEFNADSGAQQERRKIPHKWQRVLTAFLAGRSFHRFHSSVSEIQAKGAKAGRPGAPMKRPIEMQANYYAKPCHGKAAAIAAYNYGVLPMESCQRLFARNPDWRDA